MAMFTTRCYFYYYHCHDSHYCNDCDHLDYECHSYSNQSQHHENQGPRRPGRAQRALSRRAMPAGPLFVQIRGVRHHFAQFLSLLQDIRRKHEIARGGFSRIFMFLMLASFWRGSGTNSIQAVVAAGQPPSLQERALLVAEAHVGNPCIGGQRRHSDGE